MSVRPFAEPQLQPARFAFGGDALAQAETVAVDGATPWADYVWLARGERSRLYPVIRDFLMAIETAAASVSADQVNEFRHRRRLSLLKFRVKQLVYSACGHRKKQDKYAGRIANEQRAIRDAAITLGAGRLRRGPLSETMDRFGSDKGSGNHNYASLYDRLFRPERDRYTRVFELGIGSNNLDTPSNMGAAGVPGASLRGWREYFARAAVFGADVDRRILFEEERIRTAFVDQTRPDTIDRLFASIGGEFDLIVDDGLHHVDANRTFFDGAFKRLKDGGIYIIEDVGSHARDAYRAFLSPYDAAILDIPHPPNHDNNCLAIVVKEGEELH
jgi:hypothetical protein